MARTVRKVLFSRIGWMKFYDGPKPDDPRPIGGGASNRKRLGTERFNFQKCGRYFYGFVQPPVRSGKIKLERIVPGTLSDSLEGVLLIFVARKFGMGNQCVVGWYKDATVYREHQPSSLSRRKKLHYSAITQTHNAVLLPVNMRTWPVPAGKGGGIGQANVFYLYRNNDGRKKPLHWVSKILRLIENCRFRNKW